MVEGEGGHLPAGPRLGVLRQACLISYWQVEALCILYICLSPDVILSFSNPKVIQFLLHPQVAQPGGEGRKGSWLTDSWGGGPSPPSASPVAWVRELPEHTGPQCPRWQDADAVGGACLLDADGETLRAARASLGRAAVRVCLAGRQTDWFVPLPLSSLTVRKATLVTTLFLLATDFQGNGTKTWTEKGL